MSKNYEQYVSFETAKLLKKVGFDVPCDNCYCTNEEYGGDYLIQNGIVNHNLEEELVSCPTQAVVLRWLREEKELIINTSPLCVQIKDSIVIKSYTVYVRRIGKNPFHIYVRDLPTYEEAIERGIEKCIGLMLEN